VAQFARGMCLHDDDLAADFLCFVFSVSFPVLLQLCSSVPFAFRRVFFCFIQPPVVYKKCKRIYIDLIRMRTGERAGDRADLGGGKERERERKSEGRDSLRLAVSRSRSKKNSVLSLSLPTFFSFLFLANARVPCVPSKEQRTTKDHGRLQGPSQELSEPESVRAGGALVAPARGGGDGGSCSLFLISREAVRGRAPPSPPPSLPGPSVSSSPFAISARRKLSRARPRRRMSRSAAATRSGEAREDWPIIEPPPLVDRSQTIVIAASLLSLALFSPPSDRSPQAFPFSLQKSYSHPYQNSNNPA